MPVAQGKFSAVLDGVADGAHTYTALARDGAGNASPKSAPRVVTVDTTPPQPPSLLGDDAGPKQPDFTVEGGQLTPSLKVKRNVVAEEFKADIDAIYNRSR